MANGSRLRQALTLLSGYGFSPLVALVTPLLAIPAVVIAEGAAGWTSVAVGQAVGALTAVVVSMSWPLTGPAAVARAATEELSSLYHRSLVPQVIVFGLLAPVAALIAGLATSQHSATGALMAVAFAAQGLSASWFFTGTDSPWTTVRNESATRLVATLAAVLLLLGGAPLASYPLMLLVSAVTAYWLDVRSVRRRHGPSAFPGVRSALLELRLQRAGTVARLVNSLYWTGGVVVVAAVAPRAAPVFAAADRLQKSAVNALLVVPQAMITWVARGRGAADSGRRYRAALVVDVVLSGLAGGALWLLWPVVTQFLFRGEIPGVDAVRLVSAGIVACTLLERSVVMHWLLPLQMEQFYYRVGNLAAVVALAVLAAVTTLGTASDGLLVILVVEANLAVIFLLAGSRRLCLRTTRSGRPGPDVRAVDSVVPPPARGETATKNRNASIIRRLRMGVIRLRHEEDPRHDGQDGQ